MTAKAVHSIDVVIPAFNESLHITRAIDSVRLALALAHVHGQIIVVDDASVDDTADLAGKAGAKVVIHPERRGPALAWASGARASSSAWIIVTDADCRVDSEAIAAMRDRMEDPLVGIVAAHAVMLPGAGGLVGRSARFSAVLLHEIKQRLDNHDFQPIGRLMAVRRQIWDSGISLLGPCDRVIAREAKILGMRIAYEDRAIVYYEPCRTFDELLNDYRRTRFPIAPLSSNFDSLALSTLSQASFASMRCAPFDALCWSIVQGAIWAHAKVFLRQRSNGTVVSWKTERSGTAHSRRIMK